MFMIRTIKRLMNHPLNRGRQISALAGFLKWQLSCRLFPDRVIYNWIDGARVIVSPGERGFNGNIYSGLNDFSDMSYVLHSMSPDDLFVDIGANAGAYTILACAVKGARGICFEPVPSTHRRLVDNVRLNGLSDRVRVHNLGLADQVGELFFTSGENCMNHVVTDGQSTKNAVRVPVTSVDKILENESPSMLKIDVEGFETPVIRGAHETLKKASLHTVLIELTGHGARYGFDESDIPNTMKNFGFTTYTYDPFQRELKSLDGKLNSSVNTLFIRNIDEARARVAKASKVRVGKIEI